MDQDVSVKNDGLVRLAYASRPVFPRDISFDDLVWHIVSPAVLFNEQEDINGVLWTHPNLFIQLLEGRSDTIAALFQRICADPRHRDVRRIFRMEVASRSFADWSLQDIDLKKASDLRELVEFRAPEEITEDHVRLLSESASRDHDAP